MTRKKNDGRMSASKATDATDRDVEQKLQSGLDWIERVYPIDTPGLEWFQHIVHVEKRRQRRDRFRDLGFFWLVAFVILSLYLIMVYRLPLNYFILIQILVAVLPILVSIRLVRRVGDETHGR